MLEIQLMGGFAAYWDGEPLEGMAASGPQSLLTYLLLHPGKNHPRRHVAFKLWPESTEKQALTNLRNALHRLRSALPEPERVLEVDRTSLAWHGTPDANVDLIRFNRAYEGGDWQAATEAYGGPLLPGQYQEWLLPWRDQLQDQFLQALQHLVEEREASGDLRGAVRACRRLLRSDPLHEPTYRNLMRLHLELGDRASAVGAYRTCVDVLSRELGTEVTAETEAALREILDAKETTRAHVAGPSHERRHNLPAPLTEFIGREQALNSLRQRLKASRLLTLTGPPGVGKTRLAQQLAHNRLGAYPDGAWWVDLSQLTARDHVLTASARVLGVRAEAQEPLAERLKQYLGDREMLLVMDNCEHLHELMQTLIADWLRNAPGLTILTTSREPLHLAGESLHRVKPLTSPPQGASPAAVQASEAGRFFVERAAELLPTFALSPESAQHVAEICRRLDGIPLAIELAAGQIRTLSPAEIAGRLDDVFSVLAGQRPGAPERRQTLRGAIDWSYQRLTPTERTLLRRLTVFSGGWTLPAAEAVATDPVEAESPELLERDILPTLSALLEKSQIHVVEREQQTRYAMLEIVQQFATERLKEAGERGPLWERHFEFYAQLGQQASEALAGPDQFDWLRRLGAERDNLRAALGRALEAGWSHQALTLAADLGSYWSRRDSYGEGLRWLDSALSAMGSERDPELVSRAQLARANLHYGLGNYEEAAQALTSLRQAIEGPTETLWKNRAILIEARLDWRQGEYQQAAAALEEAAEALDRLNDLRYAADARHILGHVLLDRGEIQAARTHFSHSLEQLRSLGDTLETAALVGDLGLVAYFEHDFAAAEAHFRENLATYQEVDFRDGTVRSLNRLGNVARCRQRYDQAREHYQRSLDLARRIQHQAHIVSAHHNLGYCALAEGDVEQAMHLFQRSQRLAQSLEDPKGMVDALGGLAATAAEQEQLSAALELYAAVNQLRSDLGARNWPANELETQRRKEWLSEAIEEPEFTELQARGRQLSLDQAVELAGKIFDSTGGI